MSPTHRDRLLTPLLIFLLIWTLLTYTLSFLPRPSSSSSSSIPSFVFSWNDHLIPNLHLDIVTAFPEESPHYPVGTPDAALQWDLQFPRGGGFISLPTQSHNSSSPSESNAKKYDITMYHQLRCLGFLSSSFPSSSHPTPKPRSQEESEEITHCLEYLLQMILCHSDTTLEPAYGPNLVLETRQRHLCRDWKGLYDRVDLLNA